MADIIQIRRDSAADWTSVNPTLAQGEIGYETDTGKLKIGDGATAWALLSYFTATVSDSDKGDITTSSSGTVWTIDNNAITTAKILNSNVTLAKIENIADSRILGNNTGGAAAPVALTAAQVKTLLALVKGDVGLGNVDNTSDSTKNSASVALTNKTLTSVTNTFANVVSEASSATPTPSGDSRENELYETALAANATIAAPTGTPANGNRLTIRIKDNGTARTLGWNAIYRAIGVTLPTTTVISKTIYIAAKYNSTDSKWDVLAVGQEA